MHAYEKAIADALNDIADKEIYFHSSEIMSLSDTLAYKVIGTLLSWACQPTNIMPITIARDCLKQFPVEWVSPKIKQTVFRFIDITDDWDFRRLLELCDLISIDLLKWAITLGADSTNPDIIEAVDDFNEYIIRKSVLKSLFYIFKPSSLPQMVDTLVSFCCITDKLVHLQSNCNEMYRNVNYIALV